MLKAIKIFIFFIIVLFVFNKQIISHASLYFFSKWIDREITVNKIQINYNKNLIIISDAKIKNPNGFYYKNFIEFEKIILNYNLKSLFSNLIIINNLTLENPKFFFEIIEKSSVELSPYKTQKIYDDNIGAAKKIITSQPRKIWPKKDKDTNFLILKIKINGAKAFIKTYFSLTPTKVDLSNIYYSRVGNGGDAGGYTHHKSFLKNLAVYTISRIPDLELKNFLKKIYNYKNLYKQ